MNNLKEYLQYYWSLLAYAVDSTLIYPLKSKKRSMDTKNMDTREKAMYVFINGELRKKYMPLSPLNSKLEKVYYAIFRYDLFPEIRYAWEDKSISKKQRVLCLKLLKVLYPNWEIVLQNAITKKQNRTSSLESKANFLKEFNL